MRRFLPRTFFKQLVLSSLLVQAALLGAFITYVVRTENRTVDQRWRARLDQQLDRLSGTGSKLFARGELQGIQDLLEMSQNGMTVDNARVTDLNGATLVSTKNGRGRPLDKDERALLPNVHGKQIFVLKNKQLEGVAPLVENGKTVALLWLRPNTAVAVSNITLVVRICLTYGIFALLVNLLPIFLIVRTMTRPLSRLRDATMKLQQSPVSSTVFPLPVTTRNEAGELTNSVNSMVSEMEQQRSELLEAMALLDSTLENAPTGFALFDRELHYVRVNTFLADAHGVPASEHEGRSSSDFYPAESAHLKASCITRVFETGEPIRDFQLSGEMSNAPGVERSWEMHFYLIWSKQREINWVGVIVVEITERLKSEEALRKTEKLAATGRLAASIAHEINNPLEAVTNLLYLLSTKPELDAESAGFVETAQSELARVSEITQQTLRFYRQSTSPAETDLADILSSIVTLYQPRMTSSSVEVTKRFRGETRVFGFSGELRQVFANLVGNAIDAMPQGGTLALSLRRDTRYLAGGDRVSGVRVTVADTGSGMSAETAARIFEAFYTTKQATGTGLGLWVCEEILRKHNATVKVKTRQGQRSGTAFMLFFPDATGQTVSPN